MHLNVSTLAIIRQGRDNADETDGRGEKKIRDNLSDWRIRPIRVISVLKKCNFVQNLKLKINDNCYF